MTLFLLIFLALSVRLFWFAQRNDGYDQAINYGKRATPAVRALVLASMPGSLIFLATSLISSVLERNLKHTVALLNANLIGYVSYVGDCVQVVFFGQVGESKGSVAAHGDASP